MTGGFESIESSDSSAGAGIANNKLHALARFGMLANISRGIWGSQLVKIFLTYLSTACAFFAVSMVLSFLIGRTIATQLYLS
jgi:uncharacterized membrane protein YeaQ/YmgE (transglycosylase-associated protein family)